MDIYEVFNKLRYHHEDEVVGHSYLFQNLKVFGVLLYVS